MFTRIFWRSTIERAVKSFAQCLAAVLGVGGIGLLDADWPTALSTAGMAALLSVLTSLASERVGTPNDPSLVPTPAAAPLRELRESRAREGLGSPDSRNCRREDGLSRLVG